MIYIVNGYPESGKTTFEDMVLSIVGEEIFGYKISTVDFIKNIAAQCGWDGSKSPANRRFLSDLKNLLTYWNDVPFKKIKTEIERIHSTWQDYDVDLNKCIIFIDCREPKEIERLCSIFGAKSLLIKRDIHAEISNSADASVLYYNYDEIITNDGTLYDLAVKAVDFAKKNNLYGCDNPFTIDLFGNIKI